MEFYYPLLVSGREEPDVWEESEWLNTYVKNAEPVAH